MTAVGHGVFFLEARRRRRVKFDARHHLLRLLEEFHPFEMICTIHGQNLRELVEAEVLGLFLTDRMSIWDDHMG